MTQPNTNNSDIDHSIDVRYAPDVETAFNRFIEKWCPEYYSHLIDSDDNDGQFIRNKIAQEANKSRLEIRLYELNMLLHKEVCEVMLGWSKQCDIKGKDCVRIRKRIAQLKAEKGKL